MSMARCAVRRGFFVLRDCGQPAAGACANCGRPACAEHLAVARGHPRCVECRAQVSSGEADWGSALAAFSYRQQYYSSRPQHHWHYSSYDSGDYGAFDTGPADPQGGDDDAGGGFFDS